MGKIIVKKDLRLVVRSNNNIFPYDGVLIGENAYYVTCVHGDIYGNLALKINNISNIGVFPNTLRSVLNDRLGLKLQNTDKIYIIPCFPKSVRSRFRKDLSKNNIFILCNNWSTDVGLIYYDGEFGSKKINKNNRITLFIGKCSDMEKAWNNNIIKKMADEL